MTGQSIAPAHSYWDRYYNDEFIFGMGTEDILSMLSSVPPVGTWADLGAGSESLLWAIPLRAQRLIAVDIDTDRLRLLRTLATRARPRPAYRTALRLCGRTGADFAARCTRLTATITADCMTGTAPVQPGSLDLVTQFGLLGLAHNREELLRGWRCAHAPLATGGWCAGANWVPSPAHPHAADRIRLDRELFAEAFATAHIIPLHLDRIRIPADPDFAAVWIYLGRKADTT
jgi:hypothetical protein